MRVELNKLKVLAVMAILLLVTPAVRTVVAQQTKAEQAFASARELFDQENWNAAAAKFEEFLAQYPQDKYVPAAHYWLAMTLKKQTKYAEADDHLARLLNEFPNSSWVNDARALRVEIAGLTHNEAMVVQSAGDENESVKLAALQSLLRLDPPQALKLIADVLRPDAKESLDLKLSVLTLLERGGGKAAIPLLAQVINEQTVTRLRIRAIYALATIDDSSVFDVLKAASNSEDKQVAEASLFAIGQQEGEPAADGLIQIYDGAQDMATRKQTILALALSHQPSAQAKLWEIARQPDGNAELRSKAILALGQRGELQALDKLIQLYDQEKNDDVKRWIILALAPSSEKTVTRKLMVIAKNDPSPGLRQLALVSLQQHSSDPEVKKFLQEE